MTQVDPEDVLYFWFGELDSDGLALESQVARWWKKDAKFDDVIRSRFGDTHQRLADGRGEDWCENPRGTLAFIIVLDQFSRNLYRNDPAMFTHDDRARAATDHGLERGFDRELGLDGRAFFYMPLMHSEAIADQDRCVELFTVLHDETEGRARARAANSLGHAHKHREVVRRFGRFPHRNPVLGRTSTGEEFAFLQQPGSSFG